jgi:outer membrane receptor protein involved in Fe transport
MAVALMTLSAAAWADDADQAGDEEGAPLEEVVVTGTSRARAAYDTPLAATTLDADRLSMLNSNSQADILNSVPTIKAEGGGGEVAANVFIKGLPSGGQYQFTPLEYDGIPVFSSFGLNSSAFDVFYRNDLGIERLEFVRGGVSNLFGPGSVAGVINYIRRPAVRRRSRRSRSRSPRTIAIAAMSRSAGRWARAAISSMRCRASIARMTVRSSPATIPRAIRSAAI